MEIWPQTDQLDDGHGDDRDACGEEADDEPALFVGYLHLQHDYGWENNDCEVGEDVENSNDDI